MISRRNRRKNGGVLKLFFLVFFSLVFFSLVLGYLRNKRDFISPLASVAEKTVKRIESSSGKENKLANLVISNLQGSGGTYAVIIKNLKTGEGFSFNEDVPFQSASLGNAGNVQAGAGRACRR